LSKSSRGFLPLPRCVFIGTKTTSTITSEVAFWWLHWDTSSCVEIFGEIFSWFSSTRFNLSLCCWRRFTRLVKSVFSSEADGRGGSWFVACARLYGGRKAGENCGESPVAEGITLFSVFREALTTFLFWFIVSRMGINQSWRVWIAIELWLRWRIYSRWFFYAFQP